MSSMMSMWGGLPRWTKWGAMAALVVIVYFAIVEPGKNFIGGYIKRSDKIESDIARDKELSNPQSEGGRLVTIGRQNFGEPLLPTDKSASAETLYRVVDRVLKEHGIEDAKIAEHKSQLRSDLLGPVLGEGVTVERFTVDVTFETDAQTALDVLAELEQAPEVTAVSRIKVDKQTARGSSGTLDPDQAVRVTVSPEVWIAGTPGNGGGE